LNEGISTLIYDGDCSFCIRCVEWLKIITKDKVEYLSFQSSRERFPGILIGDCERSIHWIDINGNVFEEAEAIFRTLASVSEKAWLLWVYENIPGFALVAKSIYKIVSKNRKFLGSIC
jgi:predicted DCC family thiol-disulfide oxidoreductase YuxK